MPVDKVRPLKFESASTGGTEEDQAPTETNPQEDYLASKGLALEGNDDRRIDLDQHGSIKFVDAFNQALTIKHLTDEIADLTSIFVDSYHAMTSTDISNNYFDLPNKIIPNTLQLFRGSLAVHEGDAYTLSTVNGKTRVTIIGEMASTGSDPLSNNEKLYYQYLYTNGVIMGVFEKVKKVLDANDITNGYIDLDYIAVAGSVSGYIDSLRIHETDHYALSEVSGKTRVTFAGDIAANGSQALVAGEVLYFYYKR